MTPAYVSRTDWRGLTLIALAHAGVLFALLNIKPVAEAVGLPRPLMVSLLTVAEPEPPKEAHKDAPKPLPQKPHAMPRVELLQPPPVLAAREEAPAPVTVPEPQPQPAPLPAVLPAPVPEPVRHVVAAAPAPAPAPVIPPRFDADYLDNPAPAYPGLSRRLGEQGRVLLRVFVSPDGAAAQVEIRESSGFERLDRAARDTVLRWRFVPARQGERGVAAWVLVPITFSIRS